jgi:hypothetical protein
MRVAATRPHASTQAGDDGDDTVKRDETRWDATGRTSGPLRAFRAT